MSIGFADQVGIEGSGVRDERGVGYEESFRR